MEIAAESRGWDPYIVLQCSHCMRPSDFLVFLAKDATILYACKECGTMFSRTVGKWDWRRLSMEGD